VAIDPDDLIVLRGLEGNERADQLNALQRLLAPHVDVLTVFWWIVWFTVLGLFLWRELIAPLWARRRGAEPKDAGGT
jgi:hypothetical protein